MQGSDKKMQSKFLFTLHYRRHQPYCWQVALQQSLLPLGVDSNKVMKYYFNHTGRI
jgi:hypothetical protein